MANRAYLLKTSGEVSEELFEAKNTIPLFWFTLLDVALIESTENELISSFGNEAEDAEWATVKIAKKRFIANLFSGKPFIENYFSSKINVYNDFINYLDKTFNDNDILELDLLDIANFDGVTHLVEEIKKILKNIKATDSQLFSFKPDNSLFSFVGYDGFYRDDFRNYSSDYLAYCLNEEKEQKSQEAQLTKQQSKDKRKEILKNSLMFIVGITFIGGSVFGLIKDPSHYLTGIVGILLGISFAVFGIVKLKG